LISDPKLVLRVAARFQRRANNPRKDVKEQVQPVNKPKGIDREVLKDFGETDKKHDDETTNPSKKDLRPKDVFQPVPNHVNVLDYAKKGWPGDSGTYKDMDETLSKKVPKDKGHGTVNNLSQYLIETDGGGGTPPVKK
jgi:hypothetical protein